MELTSNELKTIQTFFKAKPVKKAFLFGSYLHNEATSESDIDILVELDYSQHIGLGFVKMKQDLEKILNKKVDLLSEKAVSKYILPFIQQEKKLIYER
jgi:predicted nucleotidyltransferase